MTININEFNKAQFVGDIINIFENFLEEKGVNIPNDEKDEDDFAAIIYGTDYGWLQTDIESLLEDWGDEEEEEEKSRSVLRRERIMEGKD